MPAKGTVAGRPGLAATCVNKRPCFQCFQRSHVCCRGSAPISPAQLGGPEKNWSGHKAGWKTQPDLELGLVGVVGGANGKHGCSFPLLGVECRCIISRGWRQTAALPAPLATKTEIHGDAEVRQQPRLLTAVTAALPTTELTSFVSFLAYFTFLLRLPVPRLPAYHAANG